MSNGEAEPMTVYDPPRRILVKTSTGWADLAIQGPQGPGVASGGSAGQILSKKTGTDYDTQWIAPPAGLPPYAVQVTDWNNAVTDGFYWGNQAAHDPAVSWGGDHFVGYVVAEDASNCHQFVWIPNMTVPQTYVRARVSGTWDPWALFTLVPNGGLTGQALVKLSDTDGAYGWGASGADLVYNGDFPANTPYTDGDIVISGGIAYLCVTPTAAAPVPWPGGPTLAPNPMPTYGTSFPASPIDGQRHVLVDSVTNPSYQWEFRYNAGNTSAYKWEFVGGSTLLGSDPSQIATIGDNAWHGTGMQFTMGRAGIYDFGYATRFWNAAGLAHGGLSVNGAAPTADVIYSVYVNTSTMTLTKTPIRLTLPAGAVVAFQLNTVVALNSDNRSLACIPVRVS